MRLDTPEVYPREEYDLLCDSDLINEHTRELLELTRRTCVQKNDYYYTFPDYTTSQLAKGSNRKLCRMYADIGVQCFPGNIRGTLMCKHHVDIDIVNCHPSILLNLCDNLQTSTCEYLRHYVEHRESCLQNLIENNIAKDRAEAKMYHIRCLYSDREQTHTEFLQKLSSEIMKIKRDLHEHESSKAVVEQYNTELKKADRRSKNPYGSFLFVLLETYEKKILNTIVETAEKFNYHATTLMHDGFIARTPNGVHVDEDAEADLCDELEDAIFAQYKFRINVKIKPFPGVYTLEQLRKSQRAYLGASLCTKIGRAHV